MNETFSVSPFSQQHVYLECWIIEKDGEVEVMNDSSSGQTVAEEKEEEDGKCCEGHSRASARSPSSTFSSPSAEVFDPNLTICLSRIDVFE